MSLNSIITFMINTNLRIRFCHYKHSQDHFKTVCIHVKLFFFCSDTNQK